VKGFKVGSEFAVFVLFFGLALIEAFRNQRWPEAAVFVLLGIAFLSAGSGKK